MKPKPVPKEIVAYPFQSSLGPALLITYETPDAIEFVIGLSEFGTLQYSALRNSMVLIVSSTFDWQEVLEYIESFND